MKKRIEWIDLARAIAMLFVMLGHFFPNNQLFFVITSPVKIPLFFVISGYLMNVDRYNFKEFVKIKSKSLLIPYFVLSIIRSLPTLGLLIYKSNENILTWVYKTCSSIVYGDLLWFIPCLFISETVFYICHIIAKRVECSKWVYRHKIDGFWITSFIVSLISGTALVLCRSGNHLFWHLDTALVLLVCLTAGQIYRRFENEISGKKFVFFGMLFAYFFSLLLQTEIYGFVSIDPNNNIYPSSILTLVTMVVGTFSVMTICKTIAVYPRSLIFIGQNTLVYYAFHTVFKPFVEKAFEFCRFYNASSFVSNVLVFLVCCVLCAIPATVINRYFPVIVGKKAI